MNTDNKYKPAEPKTIAYDYLFNYFGKDVFKEKVITSACVQLAIKVYKNGEEIKFTEEPRYKNTYLASVYSVSVDRKTMFSVKKNLKTDNLFRMVFDWDKIEAEVIGYTLDCLEDTSWPAEIMNEVPEAFKNLPFSSPCEVSEADFRDFLCKHIEDFDIPDNEHAQVPSVSFI